MPATTIATGTFSSRRAADQAIQRLVSSGFARNSIDLHRHDDDEGYDLEVHTRQENLQRVEKLLHARSPMQQMRRTTSGIVRRAGVHPAILLGAGVLVGFVIYNLIPRSAGGSSQKARSSRPRGRSRR